MNTCKGRFWIWMGMLVIASSGALAPGMAKGHSDIFVADAGGQVAVGGASELGTAEESFDMETRVFEAVLIPGFPPVPPTDYGRDEPGFNALPAGDTRIPAGAAALPGNASVSVSFAPFSLGGIVDSLFYWNGAGAVDFQPISLSQAGVAASLDSNPIGNTGMNGGLDAHPGFRLDNGGTGVPADGVYLVSPTMNVAGLATSKPFYMVWLVDALITGEAAAEEVEEALEDGSFVALGNDFGFFEEAVGYVEGNLVVPEPSGVAFAGVAVCSLFCGMRGRHAT